MEAIEIEAVRELQKQVQLLNEILKFQDSILTKVADILSMNTTFGALKEYELKAMEDLLEPYKTL